MPRDKVEIHKPPMVPQPPSFSIISIVIPVIITCITLGAFLFLGSRMQRNPNFMIFQIISMSAMMLSYTIPLFMFVHNKKTYKRNMAERETKYKEQLEKHRVELGELKQIQTTVANEMNPSPFHCVTNIEEKASSLWERSPRDEDFLSLRLGLGALPATFSINAPKQEGYEVDPLIEEAQHVASEYMRVENVPIQLPLYKSKVIGVVGNQTAVLNAIRVMVLQAVTHHSPDEVKFASFYPEWEDEQWRWMRWLPHTWDDEFIMRFVAKDKGPAHQLLDFLYGIVNRRKFARNSDYRKAFEAPCYIFLLSAPHLIEDEPILPLLLKEAEAVGACTILLADSKDSLPMQCNVIVEVTADSGKMIETVVVDNSGMGDIEHEYIPDKVSLQTAERIARTMSGMKLKRSSSGDIPKVLTLFDMFGVNQVEELQVEELWKKKRFPDTLPVPVGVRAGGKQIMLNLHDKIERSGHGPHGLMAGTTGSGKSEVIQSIIASLAIHYHPHEMAFMLIDYKGGGMSNTFNDLPHLVGSITNLEGNLIERAKISLKAELIRRQKLLNEAGNLQHIDEYYESPWREVNPLPHLVIVIDEFAQLKKDQPEFMNELISIAAIGRTLGVHLILATQKPGGVVDDKIWSNSRFRVCLRVQDDADSREMLKIPDAAWITTPGRGYLQVGSNEVFELVQFAWSGAPYLPDAESRNKQAQIYDVHLDGKRLKRKIRGMEKNSEKDEKSKKQLQVLMEYLSDAANREGLTRLPGPWLPPLPEQLILSEIDQKRQAGWNGNGWSGRDGYLSPAVGLVDDLANQRQESLLISLEEGHLPIYGMPGTGKTTFIQTMIMSLALRHSPNDVHFYILDFGRMLRDFRHLPHVGSVILDDEADKVKRLFRFLGQELANRREMIASVGAKTLRAYQIATGAEIPAIVVVIDGYMNFRNTYPNENDQLEQFLREGGSVGITFIVTANRITDIFEKFRSNFSLGITFELSDPSDYYFAVGRPTRPPVNLPEGRGLVKGQVPPLEFQAALPAEGEDETQRAAALKSLILQMNQAWTGVRPKEILPLPEEVFLTDILKDYEYQLASPLKVPVGIHVDDLLTFEADLQDGPYFVVGSPMEGGKTSFLQSWVLSLARHVLPEDLEIYLIDYRRSNQGLISLHSLPHVKGFAANDGQLAEMLPNLLERLKARNKQDFLMDQPIDSMLTVEPESKEPALLLVIDDADLFFKQLTDFTMKDQMTNIIRQGRDRDFYVIISGVTSDFPYSSNDWLSEIKSMQTGFLFGSIDANDLQFFKIPTSESSHYPNSSYNKMLPPGQGYYAKRKYVRIKGVLPIRGAQTIQDHIKLVRDKWTEMASSGYSDL